MLTIPKCVSTVSIDLLLVLIHNNLFCCKNIERKLFRYH